MAKNTSSKNALQKNSNLTTPAWQSSSISTLLLKTVAVALCQTGISTRNIEFLPPGRSAICRLKICLTPEGPMGSAPLVLHDVARLFGQVFLLWLLLNSSEKLRKRRTGGALPGEG
jgi:hypothetical protein